jgi:hypothetical protein
MLCGTFSSKKRLMSQKQSLCSPWFVCYDLCQNHSKQANSHITFRKNMCSSIISWVSTTVLGCRPRSLNRHFSSLCCSGSPCQLISHPMSSKIQVSLHLDIKLTLVMVRKYLSPKKRTVTQNSRVYISCVVCNESYQKY